MSFTAWAFIPPRQPPPPRQPQLAPGQLTPAEAVAHEWTPDELVDYMRRFGAPAPGRAIRVRGEHG